MQKISLRKLKLTDKKYFSTWWRDKDLLKLTSGILDLISDKEINEYFIKMYKNKEDFHYIINVNKKVIGHISLSKKRKDYYDIQIVIGNKKYWGKGCGTQAIQIILKKAKKIGLKHISLEVRPDNIRAIKAYEKSGFIKNGIKKYSKNKFLPKVLKMKKI